MARNGWSERFAKVAYETDGLAFEEGRAACRAGELESGARRPERVMDVPALDMRSATLKGGRITRRLLGVSPRRKRGQMTIELAVAMPVLIAVAVIAVNACTFFADCAKFDRVAREAVRVHAAAPAYGQDAGRSVALVEETIREQMSGDNLSLSVEHGVTGADFDEYTATLTFYPTLFGLGLRSEVFGVSLPQLVHRARYVVDSYKPGVVI